MHVAKTTCLDHRPDVHRLAKVHLHLLLVYNNQGVVRLEESIRPALLSLPICKSVHASYNVWLPRSSSRRLQLLFLTTPVLTNQDV